MSMVIAGGISHMAKDDPGLQTFVFAALFPVNLLIILLTGGVLITGASAIVPAAVLEGKAHWTKIPVIFAVSWLGNLLGAAVFAFLIHYVDLNADVSDMKFDFNAESIKYSSADLTGQLAKKIAEKKVAKDFFQTFVKGVGCNWMVCMAVFLSGQAQDMAGKMVGIWFPISCFVAIGFEHIPANMYMMPLGLLAGADVTVWEMFYKNFLPTTLGNIFAGSVVVAMGYSYAFGALGHNQESPVPNQRVSKEFYPGVEEAEEAAAARMKPNADANVAGPTIGLGKGV
jgi:formate/nitrite transporter